MKLTKGKPLDAPKFPHVKVQLSEEDGNAFFIIGRVSKAMRRAGCSDADIEEFCEKAMSGDYDNVLLTAIKTVDCC